LLIRVTVFNRLTYRNPLFRYINYNIYIPGICLCGELLYNANIFLNRSTLYYKNIVISGVVLGTQKLRFNDRGDF